MPIARRSVAATVAPKSCVRQGTGRSIGARVTVLRSAIVHGIPRLRPSTYRTITLVAAILLGIIIVTGGAVRLSGSGLGCPDWPNCSPGRLTPRGASDVHAMVEFVNRMFTGLVSFAVIVCVLGSLLRDPRRRDLVWLSLGLVAGVIAQAVLGGLTVLFELQPPFVMAHFLLSLVLLTNALVLYQRAGQPPGAARPIVDELACADSIACSSSSRPSS